MPGDRTWYRDALLCAQTCWPSPDWTPHRDEADPAAWVAHLADAGFDAVWAWCKWHDGLCFWPTATSKHTDRDFVGELAEAARARGLRVVAYFSVGEDDLAARSNPEWKSLDAQGEPCYQAFGYDYNCLCSPYGELMAEQVREVIESYAPDAVWLDHLYFPPHGCYCPWCKERFRGRTGSQLELAGTEARLSFQAEVLEAFVNDVRTRARRRNADALVSYNGAGSWAHPAFAQLEALADFNIREGHSTSVISWGGRLLGGRDKPFEILLSGCIPERWVLWALKPQHALRTEAALAAAYGATVNVAFNPTPTGLVRDAEWRNLKALGDWLHGRRAWFDNFELVADVAVLRPAESVRAVGPYNPPGRPRIPIEHVVDFDDAGVLLRERSVGHNTPGNSRRHAVAGGYDGLVGALEEACIPSRVLTSCDPDELHAFAVVMVNGPLSSPATNAVTRYVQRGGKLLVVGRDHEILADNPALAELLGISFAGVGLRDASYIDVPSEWRGPLLDYPMLVSGRAVHCTPTGATSIAAFRAPEAEWSWHMQAGSDWHAPSDREAGPAVTRHLVGAGEAWWLGAPIGDHVGTWGTNDPWAKAWLGYLVGRLGGHRTFAVEQPPGHLRVVAGWREGDLVLHMVNVLNTSSEIYGATQAPAIAADLLLPGGDDGSRPLVELHPDGAELTPVRDGDRWRVTVSDLDIHRVVVARPPVAGS